MKLKSKIDKNKLRANRGWGIKKQKKNKTKKLMLISKSKTICSPSKLYFSLKCRLSAQNIEKIKK